MKTLYIQCNMGAAGDMLTAALLELVDDKQAVIDKLNNIGIPGVKMSAEKNVKCGITGTHFTVLVGDEEEDEHMHEHHHHDHDHEQEQHHDHDHEHEHNHEHDHEHEHNHEHDHEHEQHHDHDHEHEHHHEHDHDHEHDHGHEHHHHHDHGHEHSHEGHHHHHNGIHDIEHIVMGHLDIPENVKKDVMAVFNNVAEAECQVHGKDMDHIHFHEVGTMDAVADITAACLIMNEIKPDRVVVSPIHVGSGNVKCAHGILPVPAPATAIILKGIPTYSGEVKGELCTPTGAAILKHFADEFGSMPVMKTERIGYGMGKKDFEQANCVRAILGETQDNTDSINELNCNLDDMTAEEIGFAMEALYEAGAVEVFTTAVGTKKNRPGVLLTVLCKDDVKEAVVKAVFKNTSTIGIREQKKDRYVLKREITEVETPYGTIRRKDCSGYGVNRSKYEFDDLAAAAKKAGVSVADIKKELK